MRMSSAEYLRRALAPRLVVASGRVTSLTKLRAACRRAIGLRPRIELFFAFDDPYAALAMPGLIRIAQQRRAELAIYPLVERGIAGDPALNARRRHAVQDSLRLAQRSGLVLQRSEPLSAQDCAFLAAWTEAARGDIHQLHFAAEALEQLWFKSAGPVSEELFMRLREQYSIAPIAKSDVAALQRNTLRMNQRGHWESPAALVEGQWFLAHERLAQIDEHLETLGWTRT
jgi:2-hydroxychromene-2-carboxylate isomerase